MTPAQEEQIKLYASVIPTVDGAKYRRRHRMKLSLFVEQDGLCCLCHKPMMLVHGDQLKGGNGNKGQMATFEHKKTRLSGGLSTRSNMPLSHYTCNSRRGVQNFEKFKKIVAENGGLPPKKVCKTQIRKSLADQGDAGALEELLAKKLNLALYMQSLEEGWKPRNDHYEHLRITLDTPIKLAEGAFNASNQT